MSDSFSRGMARRADRERKKELRPYLRRIERLTAGMAPEARVKFITELRAGLRAAQDASKADES